MKVDTIKTLLLSSTILLTLFILGISQAVKEAILEKGNLEKAIYCMELLEKYKDLEASRNECFGETYVQHTPAYPDGSEAVLNAFASRFANYPDFSIDIKRAGADGDLVWIHLHAQSTPEALGSAVINIFRMKDGRFVEHWNVVQAVPAESANRNTMF